MTDVNELAVESSDSRIDPQHPWPGLLAFQEADRDFFFGRDAEADELLALVINHRVTVLFGLSGLGKTSLLGAGLFPRLRQRDYLPVRLRLDVSASEDPSSQMKTTLDLACLDADADRPEPGPNESIWEYLHRSDVEFWSPRNRLLTPVLVFDQFEETFSRTARDSVGAERQARAVETIADLAEGRVPAAVKRSLEEDPSRATGLTFDSHRYHLLIALREDYLPNLEELVPAMPSIRRSRMRLTHMRGDTAAEAVLAAGAPAHIVTEDVALRIVRLVGESAATAGRNQQLIGDMAIEPALLSVVCRDLNEQRIHTRAPTITISQLDTGEGILKQFFEDSTKDSPEPLRVALEQRFITVDGTREMVAYQTLAAVPGVSDDDIQRLINRRILRIEHREGRRLLELTHDRLTPVIREHRLRREQQQAQEQARREQLTLVAARNARVFRGVAVTLAGMLVVLLAAVVFAFFQYNRAQVQRDIAAQEAEAARRNATLAEQRRSEALAGQRLAEEARESADASRRLAEEARESAVASRRRAEEARESAIASQRRAEEFGAVARESQRRAEVAAQQMAALAEEAKKASAVAREASVAAERQRQEALALKKKAEDAAAEIVRALEESERQRLQNAELTRENQEQSALVKSYADLTASERQPPGGRTGGLRVQPQDVYGQPLSGPVTLRISNASNGRSVFSGQMPSASGGTVIKDVPPGAPYRVEVSKPGYRTVIQFATVRSANDEVPARVTLPVDPRQVARATFPAYDALPADMRRILQNSGDVGGTAARGAELYAAWTDVQRASLLNVLAFAGALRLPDGSTVSSHVQGLVAVRADRVATTVDAGLRDAIREAVFDSSFRQVSQSLAASPPGFVPVGGFKSADTSLALQVSFYASADQIPVRFIAEMDIDALGGFTRAFQVGRGQYAGAAHPYDVQQLLVFLLKIDPLYRPLP